MPMPPDELYQRILQAAGDDGRLPLSRMTGWEIFPFERQGLKVVSVEPPVLPEPPRHGEDPEECGACSYDGPRVWSDDNWSIGRMGEHGGPLVLTLMSKEHFDLPTMPDDRAAELGKLLVHIARAVESLPHVARAHISRWGDGGAHFHAWVMARPEGFQQFRGTCMAIWDDLLPRTPDDLADSDARAVAESLAASYGGTVH